MKDPFDRTKVVVRHLPPAIAQSVLMEQIDGRFAGRYKWACFRPGQSSQKNQRHSRIYIDFNKPEDVVEFAEFFNGHVFVNEKGTQFKAMVEYAPSQHVPKAWNKKDGREGTISKDPEYLEFLELLAKPVENLPSAEIQLEKKEAERAGGGIKDAPIVTPLMLFVRQKRAAKSVSQRSAANVKISRRAGGSVSSTGSSSSSSKRCSDRRRTPTPMYVIRDGSKSSRKDKGTFILASRNEQKQHLDKSATMTSGNGKDAADNETVLGAMEGISSGSDSIRKKVVLLKGKEREFSLVPGVTHQHQSVATSPGNSSSFKQTSRRGASGMMIRNVLSKEAHNSEKMQVQNLEKERRPPRPPSIRSLSKDRNFNASVGDRRNNDDNISVNDLHLSVLTDKQDRRVRSKDRHWAPLRRSDGAHTSDDSFQSHSVQALMEPMEHLSFTSSVAKVGEDDTGNQNSHRSGRGGISVSFQDGSPTHGEVKGDSSILCKSGESKAIGGRGGLSITENGTHRYNGRRGVKEVDGSVSLSDGKHIKRGMVGYGSHEKQIWVQKTGSG